MAIKLPKVVLVFSCYYLSLKQISLLPNIRLDIKGLVLAGSAPMVVVEKTVKYFALDSEGKPKAKASTTMFCILKILKK